MSSIEISGENITTKEVNAEIRKSLQENKTEINIMDTERLNSIVVGVQDEATFNLTGDYGDFIGALNNGSKITIDGSVNKYLGDNMTTGEIILNGHAGDGVGFGKSNGDIVVKGNAGDALGQLHKGGKIIVDGNIGSTAGLYMLDGEIIVTGNSGKELGDWMIGGTIFIAGEYQLGYNAKEESLTAEDKNALNDVLSKYGIDKKAEDFTKIVKEQLRPFYGK